MNFKGLQEKYQQLLVENNRLKEEVNRLRAETGRAAAQEELRESVSTAPEHLSDSEPELFDQQAENEPAQSVEGLNKRSTPEEKLRLFLSLFRGRNDVFAKRWENKGKAVAGYSPVCGNEWKPDICRKPKVLR